MPKAVDEQDARSDELLGLLETESAAPGGPEAGDPGSPAPVSTPNTPSDAAPAGGVPPADTPAGEPVVEDAAALKRQLEYEKHRNDSLQGRLESQLRPLNDMVRELRGQITTLETKLAQSEAQSRSAVPAYMRHLKPDEVEALGREAVDAQSRIARGVAEDVVQTREGEIADRQKDVDARIAALEEQRQAQSMSSFWDRVEAQVPGARKIDETDPRWGTFLDTPDPLSGRLRREIGGAAVNAGDVRRVADLVQEFKGWVGEGVPARPAAPVVARPEAVRAAPAPVSPAAQSSATVIRHSQIKRFYDDWTRGKFGADDKRALQIEAAIMKAVDEGRVIDG